MFHMSGRLLVLTVCAMLLLSGFSFSTDNETSQNSTAENGTVSNSANERAQNENAIESSGESALAQNENEAATGSNSTENESPINAATNATAQFETNAPETQAANENAAEIGASASGNETALAENESTAGANASESQTTFEELQPRLSVRVHEVSEEADSITLLTLASGSNETQDEAHEEAVLAGELLNETAGEGETAPEGGPSLSIRIHEIADDISSITVMTVAAESNETELQNVTAPNNETVLANESAGTAAETTGAENRNAGEIARTTAGAANENSSGTAAADESIIPPETTSENSLSIRVHEIADDTSNITLMTVASGQNESAAESETLDEFPISEAILPLLNALIAQNASGSLAINAQLAAGNATENETGNAAAMQNANAAANAEAQNETESAALQNITPASAFGLTLYPTQVQNSLPPISVQEMHKTAESSMVENAGLKYFSFSAPKAGENQYVVAQGSRNYDFEYGDFSLSAWFKTSEPHMGTILSRGSYVVGKQYSLEMYPDGVLHFSMSNSDTSLAAETQTAFNDGNWHHVVATRDRNGISLYVDGSLQAYTHGAPLGISNDGDLSIGSSMVDYQWSGLARYPFVGDIADPKVFNRALSAQQSRALWNAGRST